MVANLFRQPSSGEHQKFVLALSVISLLNDKRADCDLAMLIHEINMLKKPDYGGFYCLLHGFIVF